MKITPLPSVKEVEKKIEFTVTTNGEQSNGSVSEQVQGILTQDRNHAYTSLVEGIEGMRKEEYHSCVAPPCLDVSYPCEHIIEWEVYNKTLNDIIEKVVKPLYGKG